MIDPQEVLSRDACSAGFEDWAEALAVIADRHGDRSAATMVRFLHHIYRRERALQESLRA